jgi:RNA-directed DNA polymerase
MTGNEPNQPPAVPAKAKQGGADPRPSWDWVEGSVWTKQMLATLNQGIKGGKWYSLIDKVWKEENLDSALRAVIRNKGGGGIDGLQTEHLKEKQQQIRSKLQQQLRDGSYRPRPVKRVWIPKLGSKELRPLGIPTVTDRVVQTALRNVIEPIFERDFAPHSYGFRPKRGAHDGLREVADHLQTGNCWVIDADIKGYFDNIPQDKLLAAVAAKISDGRVLELIEHLLQQGVMESGKGWKPTNQGTPQGAVISPLLANIYLDPLDHLMIERGWRMVRYADDFVVLCASREQAEETLQTIGQWMEQAGLTLHPTKTRIVDASQKGGGFDFLGYHFECGKHWPRAKSKTKLKETIRQKTPRQHGESLESIIADVNKTLRGWGQYFRHSSYDLEDINSWVRQRLRAILRRRSKRPGRPTVWDQKRWPNAFFIKAGLHILRRDPQLKLPIQNMAF